ncbi:hypothetical protein PV11_04532 [Exophiala sideris]|uniref:Uncharacterized protein n=1 Tax=Exophiala sideris TaxID=1016849 RepID=A0A0D1YHT7_9EURO|nr:hypothetical protein PV11_04532 [Exophiala sideris]
MEQNSNKELRRLCSTRRPRLVIVIQWALSRPQARRIVAQVAPRAMGYVGHRSSFSLESLPPRLQAKPSFKLANSIDRMVDKVSQAHEYYVDCSAWSNTTRARRKTT